MSLIAVWLWGLATADAAELVWLDPSPPADDVAMVKAAAGVTGAVRTPEAFRAAATDVGPEDEAAWTALEVALREVRPFETRLDGELVIMDDLAAVIGELTIVPSDEARDTLYAALTYQGFAVDRYWMGGLAEADDAGPYRTLLPDGSALPTPWLDAAALAPDRAITPYEIAEATQRANYAAGKEAAEVLLPGRIEVAGALPAGASLVVDGRVVDPGPTGRVRVRPGQHYVHVMRDGHVLARQAARVGPTETLTVSVPLTDAVWSGWLDAVRAGETTSVPAEIAPSVAAWDGEVIVAWSGPRRPEAVRVTSAGVEPLSVRPAVASSASSSASSSDLLVQVAAGVGGGWMSSGDFYLQDPANVPNSRAAVNAGALDVVAEFGIQMGWFRASIVGDLGIPLGEYSVAYTGDEARMRVRPDVSLALGIKYAQLTGGFLFPYHPSVGARATVPVFKGLEVLATFRAGLPVQLTREDGSAWRGEPVWQAWAGIGYRFGVPIGG